MNPEKLLKRYFNYTGLKEEQKRIIEEIMHLHDCVGILPTGYGKSITFQLPALCLDGITLVITPLISLMRDQVIHLKERGIPAEYINSLQDELEQNRIYHKLRRNQIKLLYVSAERLQTYRFIEEIRYSKIDLLVCDEAHTILWCEDFRVSLGKIPQFIESLGYRPPILALTATAPLATIEKMKRYLQLNQPKVVLANCDRKNIYYRMIHTSHKIKSLTDYLKNHEKELGIIYCLTIQKCKEVYHDLKELGHSAGLYHGALSVREKEKVQDDFKNHTIQIMVCTNAFGMGIDIAEIRFVVCYDMPCCIEDFLQQSGRAGRDNGYAEAIILFDQRDIHTIRYFIEHNENKERTSKELHLIKKDKYKKLNQMIEFCLTKKCLHQYVNRYLHQVHNGNCKMCDNCKK